LLVLVTALVGAAAAGRNQGAARTQWVGTVRALGATRRDVVTAALIETVAVGVVAGVVGVATGWAVNAALIRAAGGTFAGDWPSLPAATLTLATALALGVSLILGGAPAYWAARTTPAAALRPVGPADVEAPRHRIPTVALVIAALATTGLLMARGAAGEANSRVPESVYYVLAVLLLAAIFLLASRALLAPVTALGTGLARRRHRILVATGGAIVQHPANAVSIAATFATGGLCAGAEVWNWVSSTQGGTAESPLRQWSEAVEAAGMATLLTTAGLGTAVLVMGTAIWIGHGRLKSDAAIYGALGLSRRDRQVAAMAQVIITGSTGGALGLVAGVLAAGAINAILLATGDAPSPEAGAILGLLGRGTVVGLGALAGVVLVSAATALVAGRAVDGADPAALKRSASRAGTSF